MTYTCYSMRVRAFQTVLAAGLVLLTAGTSQAFEVLGIGTEALLGNDLTDLGDDGDEAAYAPPVLGGFDATFFSSDEPGFGGGEFAFNVFDNTVGGGNAKWCCGTAFPQTVGAILNAPFQLTHFTVTSGNDTDARRPRVWEIQGSNDSTDGFDGTWATIFRQDNPDTPLWDAHNQVIRFNSGGEDFPDQTEGYSRFRMVTEATGSTTGAFFQINEIEFFGETDFLRGDFNADGVINRDDFNVLRDNMSAQFAGPVTHDNGDYNLNGTVDLLDFFEFKENFPGALAQAGAVPEPSSIALAVCGLFAVAFGVIRRRSQPLA